MGIICHRPFYILYIFEDNANVVQEVSTVPLPAAAWLFGSGLIGMFGFAQRRKALQATQ